MPEIPVLNNPVNARLEIIKTVYRLSDKQAKKRVKLNPAQIEGSYYSELKYELRFLQERGLVDYTGNLISRNFQVALTKKGVQWIEDAYLSLSLDENEKKAQLDRLFALIKM